MPAAWAAPRVIASFAVPPVTVSVFVTVSVLLPAEGQGQAVGPGTEVDLAGGLGGAERDRIVQAAAGDGFGGGDGERVVAGRGQVQDVCAGAEIDRARRLRRCRA